MLKEVLKVAKVIALVSGKGGVGKTVITANIGRELAKLGKKVLLIDMDTGLRNLDIILGVEDRIVYDITDVLNGAAELSAVLVKCPKFSGVMFLPASQTKTHEDISAELLQGLVERLRSEYDYILLDSPSGVGQGFRNSTLASDLAVVVATPDKCSIRDADKVLLELEQIAATGAEVPKSALLINRDGAKFLKAGKIDKKKIASRLAMEVLGIISEGNLIKDIRKIANRI